MEVVSHKVATVPLSPSTRVERREPGSPPSPRPRWNAGSSASSVGKSSGVLPSGNSLLSLKAYYRKLRTFKGTVKALINLRRFPTGKSTDESAADCATSAAINDARRTISSVARITTDGASLNALQNQVNSLVNDGHVITEIDRSMVGEVSYRQQGNLEHYTEDNLVKRVALQKHPHMIALTQRLWMCAVQPDGSTKATCSDGSEALLKFASYESFMLRLHRLILPEFDIAASRELILDDWTRDTNGADHLDYAYFHLSMFELVDLWTDTVDDEDYISLLYCIMHSLTFVWGERHLLKPLEDINPVDILEESKSVTLKDITSDLSPELNSASANSFRELIVSSTPRAPRNLSGVAEGENESERRSSVSHGDQSLSLLTHDPARTSKDNLGTKLGANLASSGVGPSNLSELIAANKTKRGPKESGLGEVASSEQTGNENRRSSRTGSRAKSASAMAARRASTLQRQAAASSKLRDLNSFGGYTPHVVYDTSSRAFDQDFSASPLTVKAYGHQQTGGVQGEFQRDREFILELEQSDHLSGGLLGISGLQSFSIKPKSAAPRSLTPGQFSETSGQELQYTFGIQAPGFSGAIDSSKADGTRIASFTYGESSPRPPPLQIGSLGLHDPNHSSALKPTTYTLLSPTNSPRPQSSMSGNSTASAMSPRAASASYKRQRQPSTGPAAHRPAGNPSLVAANSPRSKLNTSEVDSDVLRGVRANPAGSPGHQMASTVPSADPMLITGRAASPRGAYHGSVATVYANLARQPTNRGIEDFSSLVVTGQDHEAKSQRAEDQTKQHGLPEVAPPSTKFPANLLNRIIPNRSTLSPPTARRVSATKLRHQPSRRMPMGSRPGSSRQVAQPTCPVDFSVQSFGLSGRTNGST